MTSGQQADVRVAVVGSGLAGLATAYYLASAQLDKGKHVHVDLLERHEKLGMDAESVSVERDNKPLRIDVPMRSFSEGMLPANTGYYPELLALYRSLDMKFRPSRFTFAFATSPSQPELVREHGPDPVFLYDGRQQNRKITIYPKQTSMKSRVQTWIYVLEIAFSYVLLNFLAFYHSAMRHTSDPNHKISRQTISAWCEKSWISKKFTDDLLFPLFGSIMTTNLDSVRKLPASELLEYVARTFFNQHYTVDGGVQLVVQALSKPLPIEHILLGVTIVDLLPVEHTDRRQILLRVQTSQGLDLELPAYDHLVFATQCTQTSRLIQMYERHLQGKQDADIKRCQDLTQVLAKMRYEQSTVVCHTDTTIMPRDQTLWRDLNLVRGEASEDANRFTMATHLIWRAKDNAQVVMQTTNPLSELYPDSKSWISRSTFERFVLNITGRDARRALFQHANEKKLSDPYANSRKQLRLGPLQGRPPKQDDTDGSAQVQFPGIWLTGSWSFGVPLLEGMCVSHAGCVSSARLVSTRLLESEGYSTAHI